jgi:hypothetical protein
MKTPGNSAGAYDAGFLMALAEAADSQSRLRTQTLKTRNARVGLFGLSFLVSPVDPGHFMWM